MDRFLTHFTFFLFGAGVTVVNVVEVGVVVVKLALGVGILVGEVFELPL